MVSKEIEDYNIIHDDKILEIKPITLRNGAKSDYYLNTKKVYSNQKLMNIVTDKIVGKITNKSNLDYDHIVGVPYGSIPLAGVVSNKLGKSLLFVRKEEKKYGTQQLIEGNYEIGDSVILIEDVITFGTSIMEIVEKIESAGLLIAGIISVFNRETGSIHDIMKKCGVSVDCIYNISKLGNYLCMNKKIDEFDYEKIVSSVAIEKKLYKNMIENNIKKSQAIKDNIKSNNNYDYVFNNELNKLLMGFVILKKTALCLSLDVTNWEVGKTVLNICGPYICMVKLHSDLLIDLNNVDEFIKELKDLARKHHFLIMEDLKMADVDKISYSKIKNSFFKYDKWANYITVHGLTAQSIYNIMKSDHHEETGFGNLTLVSQMNQNISLIDDNYSDGCFNLLRNNEDFSRLIVSQNVENKVLNRIRLTPGVKYDVRNVDSKYRRYRSIKEAIERDKNHIIIVGSDIVKEYNSDNIESRKELLKKVKIYSSLSWISFEKMNTVLIKRMKKVVENEGDLITIFDNIFKMTEEEELVFKTKNNLSKREDIIINKEHELFIREMAINKSYKELNDERYSFYYKQVLSTILIGLLSVMVNYSHITNYLYDN